MQITATLKWQKWKSDAQHRISEHTCINCFNAKLQLYLVNLVVFHATRLISGTPDVKVVWETLPLGSSLNWPIRLEIRVKPRLTGQSDWGLHSGPPVQTWPESLGDWSTSIQTWLCHWFRTATSSRLIFLILSTFYLNKCRFVKVAPSSVAFNSILKETNCLQYIDTIW